MGSAGLKFGLRNESYMGSANMDFGPKDWVCNAFRRFVKQNKD